MDKITVPYNKTSDKEVISKIFKMQYIKGFENEIRKFRKEFDASIQNKKWVQLSNEEWLYTPSKCIIYDPASIPRGIYEEKQGRYLSEDELKKAFYLDLKTNPFYCEEKNRFRYMDEYKKERWASFVICGDRYYFDDRDGTKCYRSSSFDNEYVRIIANDIPDEQPLLLYFFQKGFNIFSKGTKEKNLCWFLRELLKKGKVSVGHTIKLKDNFVGELMLGTYSAEELGDEVYDVLSKIMTGQPNKCCDGLLEKDVVDLITSETFKLEDSIKKDFLKTLLECDKKRNAMDSYDETRLKDPNGGHWDLWEVPKKGEKDKTTVSIETGWMARNPVADVKVNGIVGIDFGTKSTVVTYRDGRAKIRPLRIGKGNYTSTIVKEDYENPTVIEFKDIASFLKSYHAKEGRPDTLWDEVTVSHTAAEQMKAPTSQEMISSFFSDIKQWTSDPDRQVRIRDQKSYEKVLGQYRSLEDNPKFDPLEIYAYYLGLFINNMRQGIYLRYKLSYPAKAEMELREKIRKSFERGLKKSLPQAVLNDAECMRKFKVELGMSEPAAYAISALKGYGFGDINDEEKFVYGIFDFGGGTTDFDFGVWETELESRSYDYRITHFGENGDPYLGGENLIELMAFEVFKYNKDSLLKDHIVFSKPHNSEPFIGSEMLISDSREAIVNLKKLAESLRGFWHGDTEAVQTLTRKGEISIQLWPREGGTPKKVDLNIDVKMLDRILDEQIEDGIKQFFIALRGAFAESKSEIVGNPDKIHIFLAGNSSKSKRVVRLFKKHIESYEKGIVESGQGAAGTNYIYFYPPLGTASSEQIISGKLKPIVADIASFEDGSNVVAEKKELVQSLVDALENVDNAAIDSEQDDTAMAQPVVQSNEDKFETPEGLIDLLGKPSGKTGVAFGLLDSKVHVIQHLSAEGKIAFKYYLGYNKRQKFKTVVSPETEYNTWIEFIDVVGRDAEELYYTELAEARTNVMDIESNAVKYMMLNIDLDTVEDDSYIFIRAVDATKIEYVVATKEEMKKNKGEFDSNRITQIEIKN